MRVAIVRSDIAAVYLDDVENTSQRNFSSQPAGQSRYLKKPSDAQLQAVLAKYGIDSGTLPVSTLTAAVYPTATTVDVSPATIQGLAGISGLASGPMAAITSELQNLVAPHLVETGLALHSFAYGKLSKLMSASFQPGGSRSGVPAGIAAAVVADDGVTPFSL